ncbi:MAG: hypothetical protein NZL95_09765 [Chitinophagales bacterium]|nr:hypothetical protein [Chitinophagales bacterium]MDW8428819.1 hypothetical protein [Chitinophagales bacterium]
MRLFAWVLLCMLLAACARQTCPAYMNGAITGTEGSSPREKRHELFPEKINEHYRPPKNKF